MRKAILHIGAEKTGTTTIQGFLKINRDQLPGLGYAYLHTPGDKSQTSIAAYSVADDRVDFVRGELDIPIESPVAQFRETLRSDLKAEIDALPATVHSIIFSNEHLQSRLQTEEEIARLKTLLTPFFEAFEIVVYLRSQDELATSLYSTYVRSGGTRETILPDVDPDDLFYNFENMLNRWASVFGDECMTVKLFLRKEMVDGDVVADFLKTCGVPPHSGFKKAPDENVALAPLALEFLRKINDEIPRYIDGQLNPERGMLDIRLEYAFGGKGRAPTRDQVESFYDLFRASNDRLCKRWFPNRDTLFALNFSKYPESDEMGALTFDDAVGVAAALWRRCWAIEQRLHAEIALRDARRLMEEGNLVGAQAELSRAINCQPDSAEAHHRLGGLLLKLGQSEDAVAEAQKAVELSPENEGYKRFLNEVTRAA